MNKATSNGMTLTETVVALQAKKISALELAEEYLKKVASVNPKLNAYLEVYGDVRDQAKTADQKIAAGTGGVLAGVPLAIKDNILIKGRIASAASKMLANYVASYDAGVIEKLKAAGAIFLGRTNLDEFAMGGSTENSAYGPTKNPHDETRVAGGSSGGSAAAVAAGLAAAALGSDTGGSIRQPASFCGVVGLKPTYGTVSRSGLMAMASSLDQIGPFGQTVADTKLLYEVIKGQDPLDSTSVISISPVALKKNYIIGVPEHFLAAGINEEVLVGFRNALNKLSAAGHQVREIKLPNINYALACYYVIMPAEASTNLARYDGMRFGLHVDGENLLADYVKSRGAGFGAEVKRRILLGTYVLSAGYYDAYYGRAKEVQKLLKQDYAEAFREVDLIATPTAPTTAFKIGEKSTDPLQMYLEDIFTVPANLTGLPALSVPTGKDSRNLPLGFQLMAPHFHEDWLFDAGAVLGDVLA